MPTTGEIVGTEKKLEENKMFKKLKDKKGFTLVELIVVLVILAILAALLVPALTGYIDKARNKQIIAETRSAVMAAQTLVDEAYAQSTKAVEAADGDETKKSIMVGDKEVTYEAIAKLAELDKDKISKLKITAEGKLTQLVYTDGKVCYYSTATTAPSVTGELLENNGSYYVYSVAAASEG